MRGGEIASAPRAMQWVRPVSLGQGHHKLGGEPSGGASIISPGGLYGAAGSQMSLKGVGIGAVGNDRVDVDPRTRPISSAFGYSAAPDCARLPPCDGGFSFGNGCQAIDFARAPFENFFQMRPEFIELS
jgi:hypothetical protein